MYGNGPALPILKRACRQEKQQADNYDAKQKLADSLNE